MAGSNVEVDVVVVGSGVIGASCTYHLAAEGVRVANVEALAGPALGSTGRSFNSVRGQWADAMNIQLAWQSIRRFQTFEEDHGYDIGYRSSGYLFLIPETRWQAQLAAVELQKSFGVDVEVLDLDEAQRFCRFDPMGLGGATYGPSDGFVDGHALANAFVGMARDRGAKFFFRSPVASVRTTAQGDWQIVAGEHRLSCGYVVNAAGGWSGELAALAGLEVPIVHSRRNVYATAPLKEQHRLPLIIDVSSGAYLRSDGPRILFGQARPDEVDGFNIEVDWEWMESCLANLVGRFQWFDELPIDSKACWAGTYEVTPDHTAIVGPHPDAPTWIDACGFSGHGVMQSPEIGRIVAEQITTGSISSVDASPLSIERFRDVDAPAHIEMVF
jgi:sarcosine oxidase, subunit beta